MTYEVYVAIAATVAAFLLLWFVPLLLTRRANFTRAGDRRTGVRGGDRGSQEIEYHNLAIYRDFEFFFKVTLGIIGGVAFITTRADIPSGAVVATLVNAARWLQLLAGVTFSLFIFFHQKSKIERWHQRFTTVKIFTWQESAMVTAMLFVSFCFLLAVAPQLINVFQPLAPAG